MALNSMKIAPKLLVLTLVTVAIGAGVSIYEAMKLRSIDKTFSAVLDNDASGTIKLAEVTGNSDSIGRVLYRLIAESDRTSMEKSVAELNQVFDETDKFVETASAFYPERKEEFNTIKADLDAVRASTQPIIKAALVDDNETALKLTASSFAPARSKFDADATKQYEWAKSELKRKNEAANVVTNTTIATSYTVLALGSLLAVLLGAFAGIVQVVKPVRRLTEAMHILASGDLTIEVPGATRGDELGAMAKAVEVFKQNGIKVANMSVQETIFQKKSSDLQSDIRTVVAAAVAGDFSQRIDREYGNPDLDRFAASVNELVSSVEIGIVETRRVITSLAEGDLTDAMKGHFQGAFGELQQNVNTTMTNLRSVIGEVSAAIDTINSGAGEMRVASGDLSKRTEQQAASLEETSSALEEITVVVRNSTERAQEATHMVDEARRSTEQSSAVVKDAVSAMERIDQASGEISQIINVIDEIAFQTNLLALNAGVEAARAGDAGKGFAVVAQEVRELAQRSAVAAKDIKTLISRSSGEVQSGVKLVTATGEALGLIQEHVVKINEHVHSIATAAREQSSGLSEVSTAVHQMDQVTQQNAAMVEESTAATNRLAEEASNLARLIARFKLDDSRPNIRMADRTNKPMSSPARALGQKLTSAFGARVATAAVSKEWEEF
ncbi:methyl-accepting chemotaxis protein (plasmid) [Rhizobium sp. CB3090]|uniref:HAMP domain-containing methyl-accepting chemotaxis protein n=1 Tax=Rhizobium sp. CB3090 TaxID=3039156 RepID=UPI0024B2339D|nr:methyl-accepting chemotaxis protein [Rhizobium sp. CB3090]WFU12910.1 methyl-accepting chemotaxis protein [Rhizobium sp. CB3090]